MRKRSRRTQREKHAEHSSALMVKQGILFMSSSPMMLRSKEVMKRIPSPSRPDSSASISPKVLCHTPGTYKEEEIQQSPRRRLYSLVEICKSNNIRNHKKGDVRATAPQP